MARRFGDVRAAMALAPRQAWERLWTLACVYEDEVEWFEVVVPYVLGQIERWPEGVVERRFNPPALLGATTEPVMRRFWPLCDTLVLSSWFPVEHTVSVLGDPVLRVKRLVFHENYSKQALYDVAHRDDLEVEEVRFVKSGQLELALEILKGSSWFSRIRHLSVRGGYVDEVGASALRTCEGLELEELELELCKWSEPGIHELAAYPCLGGLERLHVQNRGMRQRGEEEVYATLGLTRAQLGPLLGGRLRRVRRLGLERMDLRMTAGRIGEELGPRLVELSLRFSTLGIEDLMAMSASGMLDEVKTLDLRSVGLAGDLSALERVELPALERLRLWHASPDDAESAEAFARRGVWGGEVREGLLDDLRSGEFRS